MTYAKELKLFSIRSLGVVLTLLSPSLLARTDAIVQLNSLSFGQTVPKTGFCELDVSSSAISSPDNMCLGGAQVAHYQITSDPNTTIVITLNLADDVGQGLRFAPKARFENNLGDSSLNLIAGSDTWFSSGSDGIIDIYVGGTLTISNAPQGLESYTLSFDLEFRRP